METIPESGHNATTVLMPEASLFSVVRPSQLTTGTTVPAAIDGLHGRSASLNIPLARKASFRMREWVKRSSSSRTTPTPGRSASESLKAHIKHLGGGRLQEVEVEGTANSTNLLVPVPRQKQKSRPGSPDSRVTQWLDFYPGPFETAKSDTHPPPVPLPSAKIPRQRQRSGSNHSDLRPAPLRVPSSERAGSSSRVSTPPKPLLRKDSKWKPLPLLPAQPVGPKQSNGDIADPSHAGMKVEGKGHERESSHSQEKSPWGQEDLSFLPIIRFGTPPPTPDSSTGRTAKTNLGREEKKDKNATGQRAAEPSDDNAGRRELPGSKPETSQGVRHSRQERKWLHVNYKGEAPFLKAWGLDIRSVSDRLEGLAILKDLMQAE